MNTCGVGQCSYVSLDEGHLEALGVLTENSWLLIAIQYLTITASQRIYIGRQKLPMFSKLAVRTI